MTVSVIIPTYNGAHKILNILRCVEQQEVKADEVIVVVDGSTDNTAELLAHATFRFNCFKVIERENGGRAKVRNNGARVATGDLLVFFDDDMEPTTDCLRNHLEHQKRYPGSIMTGAQIDKSEGTAHDFHKFKTYLSRKWYNVFGDFKQIQSLEEVFLTAANFSIPKQTFVALGGFDEALTDAEDHDLGRRAFAMGVALFVNIRAFAWHNDPITCEKYIARQREYVDAHFKLKTLREEAAWNFYVPTKNWKYYFSYFLLSTMWVRLIDKDFFTFLPRLFRFRLYSWVVTAHDTRYRIKQSANVIGIN